MYKLLIVDDEPMIVEGLKAYILAAGYPFGAVDTAPGGREALSLMEKQLPDLLITDIRMPHLDGIGLLSAVRERKWATKVIVLSGYNDFEYVRSMAVLGIENYLLKPVNEEELYATVSATIKKLDNEQALQLTAQMNAGLIRENIINRWLYGSIGENELTERAAFLNLPLEASGYQPCIIRLLGTNADKDPFLLQKFQELCAGILSENQYCCHARNYAGDMIAVYCPNEKSCPDDSFPVLLNRCLDTIKKQLPVSPYILLGSRVENYWEVSASFRDAIRMPPGETVPPGTEEDSISSPFSLRLATYVLEHYDQDLSLKTLAVHFKGNAAYIGQIFKRDIHKSFSDYLKDVRIEKARELLENSSLSAKEIAVRVGFQNITYFSTVFKKETGLSPAEYKRAFLPPAD